MEIPSKKGMGGRSNVCQKRILIWDTQSMEPEKGGGGILNNIYYMMGII